MNEKAKKIGCTDSHFVTPNGLDAKDEQGEHHTTAYDLCRIMSYCAWKSPVSKQFLEVTQTRSHTFQSLEGTGYAVSNKNVLLDMMDHVITGKPDIRPKPDIAMWLHLKKGGDIMQSHFLPAAGRTTKIISGPMQRHCFNTEWMPIICIGDRKHPWSCRI